MGTKDKTCAFDNRATKDPRATEQLEADGSPDDINNGIDGAHLMEMNFFRVNTVDFSFSDRDAIKNGN